jgi:formate dehydrogenase maturation protein FdhE
LAFCFYKKVTQVLKDLPMFPITRFSAKITNIQRSLVKGVAKNKIDLAKDKRVDGFYQCAVKTGGDYKKNIFSRMFQWVKAFVKNFKETKEKMSKFINETKTELADLGEKFNKKEFFKVVVRQNKENFKKIKESIAAAKVV